MTLIAVLALVLLSTGGAAAFDAAETFKRGGTLVSVEAGGGAQNNFERHQLQSDLELWYVAARCALLPFGPAGPRVLHGALEIGLGPAYQKYEGGHDAFWAGLTLHGRWHFLSLGRFVPYVELGAGAGGTDLNAIEINSDFAFLLSAGVGASLFITDQLAVYGGYRLIHVSNGNTSRPNRGFEADTGVVGISYFFK